jgi:hypothetical protein
MEKVSRDCALTVLSRSDQVSQKMNQGSMAGTRGGIEEEEEGDKGWWSCEDK